jgi:hypothetical protein
MFLTSGSVQRSLLAASQFAVMIDELVTYQPSAKL